MPGGAMPRVDRLVLWSVLAAWVLGLAFSSVVDGDIWFHLAGGRYLFSHGHPPRVDEFSYVSAGRPYICLHWTFQGLLYSVHRVLGMAGLSGLKALLIAGNVALFAAAAGLRFTDGSLLLLLCVTVGLSAQPTLRPLLVSLLYLQGLLLVWRRDLPGWLVPVILLLWVNVQGLFILGLFAAGLWALEQPRARVKWLALSCVTCLVNPYGIHGALFPLTLFTRIGSQNVYSQNIMEFASAAASGFYLGTPAGWACLALLTAGAAAGAAAWRRDKRRRVLLLAGLFAGFAFLYTRAFRNMPLFAVVAGWTIAQWHPAVAGWCCPKRSWRLAGVAGVLLVTGLTALAPGRAGYPNLLRQHFAARRWARPATDAVPDGAVQFLRDRQWSGRLFNDFNWGGYLIHALGPDNRIFIDQRLEVHSREHFQHYIDLAQDARTFLDLDAVHNFDLALFCHFPFRGLPKLFRTLNDHADWHLVYADHFAAVFCKDRPPNAPLLEHPLLPEPPPQPHLDRARADYIAHALDNYSPWRLPAEAAELYRAVGRAQVHDYAGHHGAAAALLAESATAAPQVGDLHFLTACAALAARDRDLFLQASNCLWAVQPSHPDLKRITDLGSRQFGTSTE